jgi:hypothetical protein
MYHESPPSPEVTAGVKHAMVCAAPPSATQFSAVANAVLHTQSAAHALSDGPQAAWKHAQIALPESKFAMLTPASTHAAAASLAAVSFGASVVDVSGFAESVPVEVSTVPESVVVVVPGLVSSPQPAAIIPIEAAITGTEISHVRIRMV